jgi:hypothetical protein
MIESTQNTKLKIRNSKLETRNSKHEILNTKLEIRNSKSKTFSKNRGRCQTSLGHIFGIIFGEYR